MQTASMRQKLLMNLKTLGNTAFGSICSFAPISLLDNDHRYVTSIGKEGLEKQLFDTLIGFFNAKHIPLDRVIFEAKEKDIHGHLDAVNYALDLGFSIALDINDSGTYNLDMSRYTYIRIDGRRLANDKNYQNKINSLINGGKPILIEEKYKDLLVGARFVF